MGVQIIFTREKRFIQGFMRIYIYPPHTKSGYISGEWLPDQDKNRIPDERESGKRTFLSLTGNTKFITEP
jgi:hypothetical protein